MARRPVRPFNVFLAGASCFVAGIALAVALEGPGWSRPSLIGLTFAAALLINGAVELRALYRAAAARDPSAEAAA